MAPPPRIKGTQDLLEMRPFNALFAVIRSYMEYYNFAEIQTPILEHLSLFRRSLGEHTDVVSKEMFLIKQQHGQEEEDTICLRPEFTAPTMRAFLEQSQVKTPWRTFTIGPVFRYERPQKGRFRQFHQWNLEIINAQSIAHDAEFLVLLDRFFHEILTMNNYVLQINFLGCAQDRVTYRETLKTWIQKIDPLLLCANCIKRSSDNILRIFDCKEASCQELYKKAPKPIAVLCSSCDGEWKELQQKLALLSVSFMINDRLVRGLDYYTKTVFEFTSSVGLGSQNAFCGGGRYDGLARTLGSETEYQALGAGIGIERLLLAFEPYKAVLEKTELKKLFLILPYDTEQSTIALLLADELRMAQVVCEILFDGSVKSRMRKADKMGAEAVLFIGPDEQQTHSVTVRFMKDGSQQQVKQNEVVKIVQKK